MESEDEPKLIFPHGFDDYIADDFEAKGVLYHAVVRLPGGKRVQVGFYSPERLAGDLRREGRTCVALPGMIVVPRVTLSCMQEAVAELYIRGYFDSLAPLPEGLDHRPPRHVNR